VRAYLRNRRSKLHCSVARWVGLCERISETGGPNSTAAWHGGWDCASVSQKPAVQTPLQRGTVDGTVRAYLRNRRSKLHRSVARWVGLCERISETGGPNSTAAWHGGTAPMAESAPVTRDGRRRLGGAPQPAHHFLSTQQIYSCAQKLTIKSQSCPWVHFVRPDPTQPVS